MFMIYSVPEKYAQLTWNNTSMLLCTAVTVSHSNCPVLILKSLKVVRRYALSRLDESPLLL